jgi:hypothetical protein
MSKVWVIIFWAVSALGAVDISEETIFLRMCSASAGVSLSTNIFVAADDESNRLRTYSREKPGVPIYQLELGSFLQIGKGNSVIDLEGAARVGDTVYWITSHARNRDGEERPTRQRFFATKVSGAEQPRLEPMGRAYGNLLRDLIAEPRFQEFELIEAAKKAPNKKGALNIEGLCARPDGSLLIAFRNPIPNKKALLIPLLNPGELVQGANGANVTAKFGEAIQLSLDGNGVRDMVQRDGEYYIIAGARDGGKDAQLYRWDGAGAPVLLHGWEARTFNPEAIMSVPGRAHEFLILSDDGSIKTGGKECKDMPEASRQFRSVLVKIGS